MTTQRKKQSRMNADKTQKTLRAEERRLALNCVHQPFRAISLSARRQTE
jgi:hypothetical protein